MASAIYHPNASQYEEGLLSDGRTKTYEASLIEPNLTIILLTLHFRRSDRLKHTARGLEAIGFNASASMYHVDRQDSVDEDYQKAPEEKKPKKSFLKKLVGGGKDKQVKI